MSISSAPIDELTLKGPNLKTRNCRHVSAPAGGRKRRIRITEVPTCFGLANAVDGHSRNNESQDMEVPMRFGTCCIPRVETTTHDSRNTDDFRPFLDGQSRNDGSRNTELPTRFGTCCIPRIETTTHDSPKCRYVSALSGWRKSR